MTARCRGADHHPDPAMAARSCRRCLERVLSDDLWAFLTTTATTKSTRS